MKSNDLRQLVEQLEQQKLTKKDFVVPSTHIRMRDGQITFSLQGDGEMRKMLESAGIKTEDIGADESYSLAPNEIFHDHLASKLQIPKAYYDRMNTRLNRSLLDDNVNHWLASESKNYLVRTFVDQSAGTGIARAFLSDRYKAIDNYDLLFTALEAIRVSGKRVDVDGDITDKRMYVRFTAPDVIKDSPILLQNYKRSKDDGNMGIMSGFILSNSEVGCGTFTIAPRIVIAACSNGNIITSEQFRKIHLGGKLENFSNVQWSEATKQKELELIMNQTKDAVTNYLTESYLGGIIATLEGKNSVLKNPVQVVENTASYLRFSEQKKSDLMNYFLKNGDPTAFGVINTLTEYAQDGNADDRYEYELVALDVLDKIPSFDISKN